MTCDINTAGRQFYVYVNKDLKCIESNLYNPQAEPGIEPDKIVKKLKFLR